MKKIKTKEELQIEINQLESKISELERSKLQSTTCLENSPVCTKIIDLDFNLQYMSNAGIRALQIDDVSAFYGKPYPLSFFPGAYKIVMNENLLRAKETGETIIQEGEILDVKGNKLWFQATVTPVYNKLGVIDHILVVSIDTSTRKQAEEKLKTSIEREKELADIVRKAPIAMAFGYPDGRLENCNSAFSLLTGYSISELQSINWNEVLTPSKWSTIEEEKLSKLSLLHKSVKYEKEYIHKDGHSVPIELTVSAKFDSAGNLLHYIGFAIDITDRKLAEKELIESEDRFRSIVEQSPLSTQIFLPNGTTTLVNRAYINLWGITLEDLKDYNILEDQQLVSLEIMPYIKRAFSGEVTSIPTVEYNSAKSFEKGKKSWVQARIYPVKDNAGNIDKIILIHEDVTEIKKAKQGFRESEERFRNAITYSPYPLMIHADGEVLQLSEEWIKQTGYTIDDIPTIETWTLKAYGKDAVPSQEFIDNLYKIDKPQNDGEWEVKKKDGKFLLWDFSSSPIGKLPNGKKMVISMASDITERKLAEDKIRAAEQNLQNTFDISPSIISKANLETGYFIEANQAVTRILGYSVEEFTSMPFMELVHPDNRQQTVSEVSNQLGGNIMTFFENRMLCKDGSYKWMAWHGSKADENGIATAIGSSINEKKNTEIKLKIALDKALESDRLKSAFLANMSHEIRTPMNGIRGFIGLLKEPNLSRSEINTYSNIIDKSSDRLLNTINDIIDIAKIEAGEMLVSKNETSINSMMDELHSFYSPEAKLKGLSLLLKPYTEQLKIITDSHKLYGIMSNLIKNAIKYTNKGSITFGYVLKKNTESVLNEQDRSIKVEFFVEDTGTGVPEERLQAIFNRFEQADIEDKKALEGSGLGLAISKAYIDMLGGDIFVESDAGKGSKFTFTIPYNKIKKEGKMKIHKTIDNKTSKLENLNLLIVEDDEVSSIFFKTMLKGIFKKVIFAKNGIEAIQLCKNDSEVDLVLMDIKMPEMDGYDTTREIRKFNKDLVIIAQTAYALHGDMEKAIDAGCNDYITKPINKTLLLEIISKHIGEYSI